MAMTQYERKHDYREEPKIQRIQLKNKLDAEFLHQALTYRGCKQNEKPADAIVQSSLDRVNAEIFHDESISEDLKAELYRIALRHYNNDTSKIFDKEKAESNRLGSVLSASTTSPTLLTSAQQKGRRYRQRESPPPPLASTTESKRRQQRWELAAKSSTKKTISWEAY